MVDIGPLDPPCDCDVIRNAAGQVVAYVGTEQCMNERHRALNAERELERLNRERDEQRRQVEREAHEEQLRQMFRRNLNDWERQLAMPPIIIGAVPGRMMPTLGAAPGWSAPPAGGVLVLPRETLERIDRCPGQRRPWEEPGLCEPDIIWVRAHWKLAGGPGLDDEPGVDMGWVTTERVR